MKIGLIDVDGHNFPNIPLMKLSAYHKNKGDLVEWYNPLFSKDIDKVYQAKVFTFTEDYPYFINAKEIIKGGTGYSLAGTLPSEVEHTFPDYSLYEDMTKDTAYGFLSRGCPRGCDFCIVAEKEGKRSYKAADLSEFWNGQRNIELCDPNMFACADWKDLAQQLIDSKAFINFNQGCDIRTMTEEKTEYIKKMNINIIHFAWDRMSDEKVVVKNLKAFKESTGWDRRKMIVYVLCNFDTTHEEDLYRVYKVRELGFHPYIMIYDKDNLPKRHLTRKMQRWVNNRFIWESVKTFDEYLGDV